MSLDFTKNEARNLVRFLRGENSVAYGVLNGRETCQVVGYDRNTRCVLVGGNLTSISIDNISVNGKLLWGGVYHVIDESASCTGTIYAYLEDYCNSLTNLKDLNPGSYPNCIVRRNNTSKGVYSDNPRCEYKSTENTYKVKKIPPKEIKKVEN